MATITKIRLNGIDYQIQNENYIVDSELNLTSQNPVENKVITQKFKDIEENTLSLDVPIIIAQPYVTSTISSGSNVILCCLALGKNLSYNWWFKRSSSQSNWEHSQGQTAYTPTLLLPNIQTGLNNFILRCQVSDGVNSIYSESVTLNIV